MDSRTKRYIAYLNSLHNYNAQNENAFGEKNVGSEFFKETVVEIGLSKYIEKFFLNDEPHIIILSGHAGDGKTSIMYEVLRDLGIEFKAYEKENEVTLKSGRQCCCIKDFSELSDEEKVETLKRVLEYPAGGKFVFMVANTGPLINTFNQIYTENQEETESKIIEALDENSGKITDINGKSIRLINVAGVDNTYFAKEFLNNLIKDELWEDCSHCEKRDFCFVYRNQRLIKENRSKVEDFIYKNYIWMMEYGTRLTIRSMTEQLAYMITGGRNCDEVKPVEKYKMLFTNLFFGCIGTEDNPRSDVILAIRETKKNRFDQKRLSADESLLIKRDYSYIFSDEFGNIIAEAEIENRNIEGWDQFLRRAYIFANIITDEKALESDYKDIFSKNFGRYINIREGKQSPGSSENSLVSDALSMIYLGSTLKKGGMNDIPLTMSRESGLMQNVQLITGMIPARRMSVIAEKTNDNSFNEGKERYVMRLKIAGDILDTVLTLPLLDYFEELKRGVVVTNVDPQLTHGVESLKSQLSAICDDSIENVIEMIELTNSGNKDIQLDFSNPYHIKEAY
ncbi:hypothetical protein [Butyrivibrio sp. YAB3001]|uniref:hypothetical protein n=1 Tax=Butyrivibrio sp. YAB3001 TaxID=1520812 RepID=UPI0008F63B1E|nr:hypothetical protein [Butyrivibrio sp. YAB3001]SFC69874.1 hypothetical protein SAMN02910398_02906 [Butyrivibrio sp. YAB3001]